MSELLDRIIHLTTLDDEALPTYGTIVRDLARALLSIERRLGTEPPAELAKALNELATLTHEGLATNRKSIDLLAAQHDYLRVKIAEHANQLSELFGTTPSKITDRLDGLRGHIARLDTVSEAIHNRLDDEIALKLLALHGTAEEHAQRLDKLEAKLNLINAQVGGHHAQIRALET